jgi:hypothetical protein
MTKKKSRTRTPSYRKHAPSGQAVVTLRGKDFYLGKYNSKESEDKYDALISEYLANGRKLPPLRTKEEITIEELAIKFLEWAEGY